LHGVSGKKIAVWVACFVVVFKFAWFHVHVVPFMLLKLYRVHECALVFLRCQVLFDYVSYFVRTRLKLGKKAL
jgi:hypothetical protein